MSNEPLSKDQEEYAKLLEEACDRNLPVELHHRRQNDDLTVARSRILAADDDYLYIDRPQCIGGSVEFVPGQKLEAYISYCDMLYMFKTEVISPACLVRLNKQKRVNGMSLSRPGRVKPGQRRAHFRVSLACSEPVHVRLHAASYVDPEICPLDARRVHGMLVDVSLGGASVLINGVGYSTFNVGDLFFMSFTLPEDEREFMYLVRVRQTRPIPDGTACRLGIQFENWPTERDLRLQQQLLQQFITQMQRAGLRQAG